MTSLAKLRVLLVEDDPDFVLITTANLEAIGHTVDHSPSMHDALVILDRFDLDYDVLVLDLGLPDIDGLEGVRAIVENSRLPVVVYTADARPELAKQAEELGAAALLVKGDADAAALALAVADAAAMRPSTQRPSERDMAFDGPEEVIGASLELLGEAGPFDRWAFIRNVGEHRVVLVRGGDGDELRPGARAEWTTVAQAAMSADSVAAIDRPIELANIELGKVSAGSALLAPIDVDGERYGTIAGWSKGTHEIPEALVRLAHYVARQLATFHGLEFDRAKETRRADIAGNAASADVLTGLGNRRAFDQLVRAEESRCRRYGHPAVVFMADLDKLKVVNDTEGHAAGDRYIRAAAAALNDAVRESDSVFRIGGDEFAVIAIECDEAAAEILDDRIRTELDRHKVEASIGWAARPPEATLEVASAVADEKMYAHKLARRAGRDAD